ncbi:MAG: hypothetical protein KA801_19875 [Syntrophorhabdaceae bacterium]|nr:hypothetical protein [Syntrophorhabdaceae bacterium]
MTTTSDRIVNEEPQDRCHVCGKTMKRFAQDYWYWYYRCECGCERLVCKEENERGYQPWPRRETPAA